MMTMVTRCVLKCCCGQETAETEGDDDDEENLSVGRRRRWRWTIRSGNWKQW